MRVIAGRFRGRQLGAPPGLRTRPTSDALRETLFNVLGPNVAGSLFVDAYAGSGAVGIEALSRGAAHVFFVERAQRAVVAIRKNLQTLDSERSATLLHRPALNALVALESAVAARGMPLSYFFLDPPYERSSEYGLLLAALAARAQLISSYTLVIAEHARRVSLEAGYGELRALRQIQQGDSTLTLFRRVPGA